MNKFYADSMLGKLSRFLRFLGYDTIYRSEEKVEEMLELSLKENRTVLSQSKQIIAQCSKRNIKSLNMPTKSITDQLRKLNSHLDLSLDVPPSKMRCSICNGGLKGREKTEIIDQIPKGTAKFYNDFWQCTSCKKIFWMGSHWEDIKRIIEKSKISEENEN